MKSPRSPLAFILTLTSFVVALSASHANVVINELMIHPQHVAGAEPTSQEFIELWNRGDESVDLTGWQFDRGVQFLFPAYTLEAGAFLVIASDPSDDTLSHITTALGPWEGRLSNRSEWVRLVDATGETVDQVRYADEGDWAVRRQVNVSGELGWEWEAPFDGDGFSLELVNPELPNDSGQNWQPSLLLGGTPGQANTQAKTSTAPLIHEVRHHPAVPSSKERVVVRAEIIGPHDEVLLHYRLSQSEPLAFSSLTMVPEASGCHAASIPPYADQSVIEFYVEARGELSRTWPAPTDALGGQAANALYQIDNEGEESDQPYYRVIMTAVEEARFRPGTFNARSDAQMHATFITTRRGEASIRYQTGIRRRGNSSRSRNPPSFRLTLPSDKPWRSMTTLNLVSQYSHLQAFGLNLFKAAELPAPDAILVQLRLNATNYANSSNQLGVHYGSYAHIQPLGDEFIEQAIPEDGAGDLYKKVSTNPQRDQKRWGVHFEDVVVYNNPNWYLTDRWTKESNSSANDWSRFQEFIRTINEAPASTYFEEVSALVNVEQWIRWFALMNLMNNRETNLSNGIDDDYSIYQGVLDPRIILLPHDLDTIFGLGDTSTSPDATVFQMLDASFGTGQARLPQLQAFFDHPQIRPRYFQELDNLMETVLSPERFEPLLDSTLAHVDPAIRERIKVFNRSRMDHVRSVIDAPLVLEPLPFPTRNEVFETTETTVTLQGTVSPRLVESILINGQPTSYDRGTGTWRAEDHALNGGLNTLRINALTESGEIFSSVSVRIQALGQGVNELSGELTQHTVLTAADGIHLVTADLLVSPDTTLTIGEGTTLAFTDGAQLTVDGTLLIEGTESKPVSLIGSEGASWRGLTLLGPSTSHRLTHATIRDLSAEEIAISLAGTHLEASHLDLSSHQGSCLALNGASLHLSDSQLSAQSLLSSGGGLAGFPLTLERNHLGTVSFVDRPVTDTTVIQLDRNAFMPGLETAFRFSGQARLTNNDFQECATAIQMDGGQTLIANQRFLNAETILDHTASSQITIEHSVMDQSGQLFVGTTANINAFVANNVVTELDRAIPDSIAPGSFIQFTYNFLDPSIATTLNTANVRAGVVIPGTDPGYNADFTLSERSVGKGAGTHGQDLGYIDQSSPAILGKPLKQTSSRSEFIAFYGSGWEQVEYRLDGGEWVQRLLPWLPEAGTFREAFVALQGLEDGDHLLEYREDAVSEINSISWTVGQSAPPVVLNEVSAINTNHEIDGSFPDWVELYNPGNTRLSLAGYQLAGEGDERLVLSDTMEIRGERYLVVSLGADNGLALNRDGETLTLYDPQGVLLDTITFGRQLSSHTLGRLPADPNTWGICEPTPGNLNQRAFSAAPSEARINEWYVASGIAYEEDFIELANSSAFPINLSGAHFEASQKFTFPTHTFLGVNDYYTLNSNDLGFGLDPWYGIVALQDENGTVFDQVFWQAQNAETSSGRQPDATGPWQILNRPSPETTNDQTVVDALRQLRLTEIYYHTDLGQAEWLELLNTSSETIDLVGLQFTDGIDFIFETSPLAPGERLVLVSDEAAFRSQYGDAPRIGGVFTGRLDNAGDTLSLALPGSKAPNILVSGYEPSWYPLTNGAGHSLVVRDETRRASEDREDWQASSLVGGTPGQAEKPLIYSSASTTSIFGDFLLFNISALNEPTSYEAINLPEGLSIDPGTGVVSGSPNVFGTFAATVRASNDIGTAEQTLLFDIAASGPLSHLQWESLPTSAAQDTPFTARLSARDALGRLVRDVNGDFEITASVNLGTGPAVFISEIRDSGTDGLTLTQLDPNTDTTGWRVLLNAAADGEIQSVHGINAAGRILNLPPVFTRLDLPENQLGFNLMWSDDDPAERQGGQRGWALVINERNEAVDFVAWGYSADQLERWAPLDDSGNRITGDLWMGDGVPHPGALGFTLARLNSADSNSAEDWQWLSPENVPALSGPSIRLGTFPVTLSSTTRLDTQEWEFALQSNAFASQIQLTAIDRISGLRVTSEPFQILPSGPPELPAALSLTAVAGQPIALPTLSHPLTEELEIDGEATLSFADSRITVQVDAPGTSQSQITARNALGESLTTIDFTILADADGDGLADIWESNEGQSDPVADPDRDGMSNLAEFLARTDPNDSASFIALTELTNQDNEIEMRWSSRPGATYTVEAGAGSVDNFILWEPVHPGWITADGDEASLKFLADPALGSDGRLLRVRVWENGMQ